MNRFYCIRKTLMAGLVLILITLFLCPKSVYAQASDPPCIHGMRIVGEQSVYLSHMGLFNSSCHDYQGLFEVNFAGTNDPQKIYLNAQKANPDENEFTIEPTEKFVLPKLASGALTSFTANIHRGQYERPATNPKLLASNVTVNIKRVLHFRQFRPGAKQPPTSEYLLFGNDAEKLAAHLIAAPPDFDQIVAVKSSFPLTNSELMKAVRLVFPNRPTPNPQANLAQALKSGVKPTVQVNGQPPNQTIQVGSQYFLETTDYQSR